MTWKKTLFGGLLLGSLALLAGCKTPADSASPRLNEQQLRDYFSRAQDPRRLWITVYRSDDGPVFSGACRLHPEQSAQLPFVSEGSSQQIIVDFKYRAIKSYRALVDTSSSHGWMTYEAALGMDAVPLGPPAYEMIPRHIYDDISGYASAASTFVFDTVYMETPLFFTRSATGSLGPLARGADKSKPDAVLGCNMLKAFRFVQVDYPRRVLTLSSTFDYQPSTNLVGTAGLRELRGAFAVQGVLNGQQQFILLDTAGDYEVAMKNAPDTPLRHVSIGSLVFRQVSATNSVALNLGMQDVPRIGNRLLSKFVVTFDFLKRTVYFEKP